MRFLSIIIFCMSFFPFSLFAKPKVKLTKNIVYKSSSLAGFNKKRHSLDICYPINDSLKSHDVVVFVHGGSWNTGKKNTYRRMARRFAEKGIVWVNVNYRLNPEVTYKAMCDDVARAVDYIHRNIAQYSGNPDRIFIAGHSAGAHIGALVAMDKQYFDAIGAPNPLKGAVMIDGFCLDLVDFFKITDPEFAKKYYNIFTNSDLEWQEATPSNYASRTNLPFFVLVGSRTYPGIKIGSERFMRALTNEGKSVQSTVCEGKKHIGMITQLFFNRKNPVLQQITDFVHSH